MTDFTPPPISPLPPAQPKQGMSTGAKVGIGCLVVAVIAAIAMALMVRACNSAVQGITKDFEANPERAAAELMIKMHPDYSVVSSNDTTKQMTIREDKTGKEMTLSFEDIKQGKFSVTDSMGNTTQLGAVKAADLPSWVPVYPGATIDGGMQSTKDGKQEGIVTMKTTDSAEKIMEFYKDATSTWPNASTSNSSLNMEGVKQSTLTIENETQKLVVIAHSTAEGINVTLQYSQP